MGILYSTDAVTKQFSPRANLDRHLVPHHVKQGESNLTSNIDRRLVPYTRDARRTKSRIEFI